MHTRNTNVVVISGCWKKVVDVYVCGWLWVDLNYGKFHIFRLHLSARAQHTTTAGGIGVRVARHSILNNSEVAREKAILHFTVCRQRTNSCNEIWLPRNYLVFCTACVCVFFFILSLTHSPLPLGIFFSHLFSGCCVYFLFLLFFLILHLSSCSASSLRLHLYAQLHWAYYYCCNMDEAWCGKCEINLYAGNVLQCSSFSH